MIRIEQAEDFNARVPVGTPVRYWPVRGELDRYHDTVTRSEAWTLGDGTPVVLLEDHVCAVAIDHVRVLPAARAQNQRWFEDEIRREAHARGLEEAACDALGLDFKSDHLSPSDVTDAASGLTKRTAHLSEELGVEPNERQPLTPAQERYLKWIEAYTRAEGMPPTYREMADGLGVTSNAVGCALLVLQRKGWIARRPVKGVSRNILLTYQGTYSRFLSDAESRWAGTYTGKPSGQ